MPIQLPPDSTGKLIETVVVTSSENREVMVLGSTTLAYAPVTSSAGLLTSLSSGTVTLSSAPTVTATAATNPWSSAPGFNVPVVSVSSGLIQISGTPAVTSTFILATLASTAGVVAPVTSSAGVIASLSSGTVTISGTVTVLSASSGLVQVSGIPTVLVASSAGLTQTVTVLSASSGFVQGYQAGTWTVQTTAGTAIATSSALGLPNYFAITPTSSVAGAALSPVTSSYGQLVGIGTTGTITSTSVVLSSAGLTQISGIPTIVVSTSAGEGAAIKAVTSTSVVLSSAGLTQISGVPAVVITSSVALAPVTVIASTVSKIGAGAGVLYSLFAFTTVPTGAVLRLYNATTANVAMGTNVVGYFPIGAQSTLSGWEDAILYPQPRPFNFATACSFDVVVTVTSTLVTASNTYVTFQYV